MNYKYLQILLFFLVVWIDGQSVSIGAEEILEPKSYKVIGSKALSKLMAILERQGHQSDLLADKSLAEKLFNECLSKSDDVCYYHGSPNKELRMLEPRMKTTRSQHEGPVVFASPCPEVASCFLFDHDDSWTHLSIGYSFDDNILKYTVTMVIADRDRFTQQDRGGSLYYLSPSKFIFDCNKGLGLNECTSKEPVKPLRQVDFNTAFEAMSHYGVKIKFLTRELFEIYRTLPFNERPDFLERSPS